MKMNKNIFPRIIKLSLALIFSLLPMLIHGQQDPQFTQYSYNPMTVNAGYTGSRGHTAILALHRSQWTGIEGAPRTITLSIDAPFKLFDGIGLSLIHDEIGPAQETYLDGNYAHTVRIGEGRNLGLGIKAGARMLSIDWSKGLFRDPEAAFNENVNSEILFTLGAGLFYYTDKSYLGLSVPNFMRNRHYDAIQESEATEDLHFFLIGGYVFDLNPNLKFKPSFYAKHVAGGVLSADVSANFLLKEALTLGLSYRIDQSISGLLGFQVSPQISFGYAYDYNSGTLGNYESGSHEFFIRYQLVSSLTAIKSPRFF